MTDTKTRYPLIFMLLTLGLLLRGQIPFYQSSEIPVTRGFESETAYFTHIAYQFDPDLDSFIDRVSTGQAQTLAGVYVPGLFAYPIIQQPKDDAVFVSTDPGVITQFNIASMFGTIGLLAHNNLAGAAFYQLHEGQDILLIYGNGDVKKYKVNHIEEFQALSPESPYSNFKPLDQPDRQLTSTDLFQKIYAQGSNLVFQTCINRDGDASWGRIFITATPGTYYRRDYLVPLYWLLGFIR